MAEGPRIVVLGAGCVGCFIGGAWASAGLRVTFIGHPKLAGDIRQSGLMLTDFSGWKEHLTDVDYRCDPQALSEADVILVTVKSGATAEAAAQIADHGRPGATLISVQNGVTNVELLRERAGPRFTIIRGMVGFNIAYLGDGHFHKGVAGTLWIDKNAATHDLAARVAGGPASIRLSDDMLGLAWGKLLINLNNAVNALSGTTLLAELRQRPYRRVFAASIREGLQVLRGSGITPTKVGPLPFPALAGVLSSPDWLFNNLFFHLWKVDGKARSSMSDDLAEGRRTEVDYLNGELVRLAQRLDRAAPVNSKIVELIHRAEAGAPPWPGPALRREVLGR